VRRGTPLAARALSPTKAVVLRSSGGPWVDAAEHHDARCTSCHAGFFFATTAGAIPFLPPRATAAPCRTGAPYHTQGSLVDRRARVAVACACRYTSVVQTIRLVVKEEGMAGMYGGMFVHLARTVPNAAIMFTIVEALTDVGV
jgi:hypothetical protein